MRILENKKAADIAGIQAQAELDIRNARKQFHKDLEKAEKDHSKESLGIWGTLWDSVKTVAKGITDKFNSTVTAAKNAYNKVLEWWKKATAKKADVPTAPAGGGGGGTPNVEAQHGFEGLVTKPTRFLVGEKGPEYVSVSPTGTAGGRGITINGPLVVIEGSADPKTARLAADLIMQELRKIA